MNRFCANCGTPLGENSKFCPSCGVESAEHLAADQSTSEKPLPNPKNNSEEPSNTSSAGITETVSPDQEETISNNPSKQRKNSHNDTNTAANVPISENVAMAYGTSGEMSFAQRLSPAGIKIVNPIKCVIDGIIRTIKSLKTVFQDKKRLIPALLLGVVWIVLMLLPKFGLNPLPVKVLSFLTFAQGGFSNNLLRAAGGLIGKGIFATLFMSLFSGGNSLKGFGTGLKTLFSSIHCKNPDERVSLIISIGMGLILYNFISGYASVWNSMGAIAAFLLALRSMGRRSGFLRNLIASLTAKKKNGEKSVDPAAINRVTAGIASGLALSLPLSAIPFVYLPYCVGVAALITGMILKIVSSGNKKQIVASFLLCAFALTLFLPVVSVAGKSDDEWAGTWTLKEIIVDDKSAGLSDYYASNNDTTVETVTMTETSYEHEFRYVGDEYISNIVELEDGEYVPIHYHAGEFFKTKITFDSPPKYLRENEHLELQVNFEILDSYIEYFDYLYYLVYGWMDVYKGKEISDQHRVAERFNNAQFDVDENATEMTTTISGYVPYGLTDGEIMGIELIVGINDHANYTKSIGHTFEEEELTTAHIYYLYEWKYGVNNLIMNTDASEGPGETDVSVPAAIAVSALGLLATLGAAGVSAGGSNAGDTDEKGSSYKMVLYKDFGNAIRYNDPAVPVYAKMVEITQEGAEVSRMDLTQHIDIFPGSGRINVRDRQISGDYMGAFVEAEAAGNTGNPEEGVISFKFNGKGGSFQNNVTFRLIGDPYIEYPGEQNNRLHTLAGSGREFTLYCMPKDFMHEPSLELEPSASELFDIRLETDKENAYKIIATDKATKPENVEKLFDSFRVEMTAKNDHNEFVRSTVEVIVCYEGLVPDWYGKDKEIRAYFADREKKEMTKTLIGFSIGVWNEQEQTLDVKPAGDVEITVTDEKELCKTIGVSWEIDSDSVSDTVSNYRFTAEKPFPSENTADIELAVKTGELTYTSDLKLIPDVQQYSNDLKQEYENCLYIIETYMEGALREKRLEQCKKTWGKFGIGDYQAYRKQVWKSAENQILQKRDSYLSQAAYADTAIVALEFAKNVGDIALDMALAPIGGPFAAILIGQAKEAVLDMVDMLVNDKLTVSDFKGFFNNRMEQMIGMMDNFFDPPEPKDPNFKKKAAIWFSCYFIYRSWYHITYDKDDSGNPAGIVNGIKAAVQDMTIKAVMVAFMNDALDDAKANSSVAKTVKKTGYSKEVDSELGQTAVSTAAELWGLTATAVIGYINSLLGSGEATV